MDAPAPLLRIKPEALKRRLDEGSVVVIDVRERDEFARERIPGAKSAPLSRFEQEDLANYRGRTVVFCCRTGNRTTVHAHRLRAAGFPDSLELEGGLLGWKQAGLPTEVDRAEPLELVRQAQIAIGLLVLLGLGLAVAISLWFALISAAAAAGLVVAGVTGFCALERLLVAAPWNRRRLD